MYPNCTLNFSHPNKLSEPYSKRYNEMSTCKAGFVRPNSVEEGVESVEGQGVVRLSKNKVGHQAEKPAPEFCRKLSLGLRNRNYNDCWSMPTPSSIGVRTSFRALPSIPPHDIAHVPFNVTKRHNEYWTSVPRASVIHEPSIYPFKNRDEFCVALRQPVLACESRTLPAQISKAFTSLVDGVCDWVADTLDSASTLGKDNSLGPSSTSQLNPNAKCFTPLNPLAEEFHPATKSNMSEIINSNHASSVGLATAAEDAPDRLKLNSLNLASRVVAPKDTDPILDKSNENLGDSLENGVENYCGSCSSETLEIESDFNVQEEYFDDDDEEDDCPAARDCSLNCSDDSSFIEFGTPSSVESCAPSCDKVVRIFPELRNDADDDVSKLDAFKTNLLEAFCERVPSEESDDDDEWDEIDASNPVFEEDVLNEFQPLFFEVGRRISQSVLNSPLDESYPSSSGSGEYKETLKTRLRNANATWDKYYSPLSPLPIRSAEGSQVKKSNVSIAPPESFVFIYEDPEMSAALVESRKSDFQRRQADKERMEMLLAPVLTARHRERVRERIHCSEGSFYH